MPVKWTPETNEILLVKILETSEVTANVKAISEAWPADRDRPTPRAISERLFKIRNNCKNKDGKATLTVSNGEKRPTPKASPQKASPQKAANSKGSKGSKAATPAASTTNGKRKRQASIQSIDSDSEPLPALGDEDSDTETGDKPFKSAKKAKTIPNFMIKEEEEYDDGDAI